MRPASSRSLLLCHVSNERSSVPTGCPYWLSVPEKAQLKILQLTGSGWVLASSLGIARPRAGKGGAVHEYWRHRLTVAMERLGYTVTHEFALGDGKAADLCASRQGAQVLVEIETGKSDVRGNIRKCANEPLLVFCTNPETREVIEERASALHSRIALLEPRTLAQLNDSLSRLLAAPAERDKQ